MDKSATAGLESQLPVTQTRATPLMQRALLLIILLAVAPALLVALNSLSKPLIMDEMEFPAVARAIVETGKPYYYRGETLPHNTGLWHPPLYILSLAFWERLFGTSIASSRAYGLTNAMLALVLIGVFAFRRLRGELGSEAIRPWHYLAIVAGLLVGSTAPILIQGSILPDIDTQLLPLLLTIAFLVLFELRRRGVRARTYWLAYTICLAILLSAKLTTPVLLLPTFLAFEIATSLSKLIRLRWSKHIGERLRRNRDVHVVVSIRSGWAAFVGRILGFLGANIAAVGLFALLWYVVAVAWGVNFRLPFLYLTQSANNPANYSAGQSFLSVVLANAPEHFGYFVQWVGYPALVFVGLMIVREFTRPHHGILAMQERVSLYVFFLLLTLNYIVLKPAPFLFPKYYPPLLIPITLLAIDFLVAISRQRSAAVILSVLVGETLLYLAYILVYGTPAGQDFILAYLETWPKDALVNTWMLVPLAAVLLISVLLFRFVHVKLLPLAVAGALAVTLGWQLTVSSAQASVPYSTTYMYGEDSLAATTDYLRANLPSGATILAPKDVGSRLQDQWHYIELTRDPRASMRRPNVGYVVFRKNDYYGHSILDTPEIASALHQAFRSEAVVGEFAIFQRR